MRNLISTLTFVSFFLPNIFFSQNTWDTTRYRKYSDRFIVTGFVSTRRFSCEIDQTNTQADSGKAALKYNAEANTITGLQFNYDKIALSFGWKSASPDVRTKGNTLYRDFSISIGENKWILDGSFRTYKGFYDENSANYMNDFKKDDPFVQIPGMEIRQMRARFRYFTNHRKFAYSAGYGYTCRQLKSAFTWILGGSVLNNRISTDSSFFHPLVRTWYGSDTNLKYIEATGISFGGGLSINIVIFKRLFMNMTFNAYLEPQWRESRYAGNLSVSKMYVSTSADGRFSMGYNGRNFFYFVNGMVDFNQMNTDKLLISSRFISGAVNIGYRFKTKCPVFYSRFKETWIYKQL